MSEISGRRRKRREHRLEQLQVSAARAFCFLYHLHLVSHVESCLLYLAASGSGVGSTQTYTLPHTHK